MEAKACSKCGESKSLDLFSRNKDGRFGRASTCKACRTTQNRVLRDQYASSQRDGLSAVKLCTRCERELPLTEFGRSRTNRQGVQTWCAECTRVNRRVLYAADPERWKSYSREWVKKNPEKARAMYRRMRLLKVYGITVEQYEQMLADQGSRCAICGTTDPGKVRGGQLTVFRVDHRHDDGRAVRGLLCHACNAGIGLLGDDAERLTVAAAYLRRHQ